MVLQECESGMDTLPLRSVISRDLLLARKRCTAQSKIILNSYKLLSVVTVNYCIKLLLGYGDVSPSNRALHNVEQNTYQYLSIYTSATTL
jgi:hypothetical protein